MSKFFVDQSNINTDSIKITGDDVNHIKRVLRLRAGDKIVICDGAGIDYFTEIKEVEENSVSTMILSKQHSSTEPPVGITLFQGIPKSDKMDYIIQKSVELGISRIIPVSTERTVVKLDSRKDAVNKTTRWQRIAFEAAKQCNRGIIPKVELPVGFDECLSLMAGVDLAIIPYEKEAENSLRNYLRSGSIKKAGMLIGPEGGFTEKEVQKAASAGIKPVTLGPRILRTETAGIAVLSILMYELGDVGR